MSATSRAKGKKKSKKASRPTRSRIRIRDVPSMANPTPVSSIPLDEDDATDASLEELFLEDTLTENRLV